MDIPTIPRFSTKLTLFNYWQMRYSLIIKRIAHLSFLYPHKAPRIATQTYMYLCTQKQILINMQQENITFNDMPQMLAVMYAKLNELGDKVDKLIPPKKSEEQQWLNVADLIEFLPTHPAEQTIYGWTSARKIPFHKKGKNIIFNKAEIEEWLKSGTYRKSEADLENEAMAFINNKRYGRK